MIRAFFSTVLALVLAAQTAGPIVVTGQLLDYEKGFLFFTTGDAFRVAPNVQIVQYGTGKPAAHAPQPRMFARVTFAPDGTVTKIELSPARLAPQGDLAGVLRFAVAFSPPEPNPELAPSHAVATAGCADRHIVPGKSVAVIFKVQVPPSTSPTDQVYMTTDQSGWNPVAYRMNRVDALHYVYTGKFMSGTVFHYLFDRGSTQSIQRGENGLEQQPYLFCVSDATTQSGNRIVYAWGDQAPATGGVPFPTAIPTPFNPNPFPNLPTPHPTHAP